MTLNLYEMGQEGHQVGLDNADKQKTTRGQIKTALALTGIAELKSNRERIAIEVMKLAKNRHDELLKGAVEEDQP